MLQHTSIFGCNATISSQTRQAQPLCTQEHSVPLHLKTKMAARLGGGAAGVRVLVQSAASVSATVSSSHRSYASCARGAYMMFLGAPGVGKGTFAGRIAPMLGVPTISTGDLIRAEIKAGSAIGKKVSAWCPSFLQF